MKFIPYGNHFLDKKDYNAILKSLRSPILTRGPEVEIFEKNIALNVGAKYAVAISSCTAGIHLALMSLKNNKKKKVLTSPISFVATSNTILLNGLKPEFVDIDRQTLNIDQNLLNKKYNKSKDIKAIVPVHLTGLAAGSKEIYNFAKKKNISVIEDAAHSFGGKYECGSKIGSCKYSDMTVFSFHPVKSITTLEGGVITTNSKDIYNSLCSLRNHGIIKKKNYPLWFYNVDKIGLNYRVSDVQCALGNSQLNKLNYIMRRRRDIAKFYDKEFSKINSISIPCFHQRSISANHLYVIKIDFRKFGITRTEFCKKMNQKKIGTQLHYIPIPLHEVYKKKGYNLKKLPNTQDYFEKAISIPIFVNLDFASQKKVIRTIKEILKDKYL